MTEARRRSVVGRSPAIAVGALLGLGALGLGLYGSWAGEDDGSELDELVGEDEITRATVSVDEYAEVVRIVGGGDIADPDKRRVADGLRHYLTDIGEAAVRQAEAAGADPANFDRPDMVAFFEELGHDEEAARLVADGMVAWVADIAEPFLAGPADDQDPADLALDPVARVMGAVEDGFDATDGAPIDGDDFERLVIEQLREDLATAAADRDGQPTPQPGEFAATLAELRPAVGAALDDLDVAASDQRRDDDDAPWS